MKKLLVSLMLVAGVVGNAQAANWQYQGTLSGGEKTYIDVDSLIFTSNARTARNGWLKYVYPNGAYTLARYEADCPTRMVRVLASYDYSTTGYLYNSATIPSNWDYTVPNSYGERWANTICLTNANYR